MEVVMSQNKTLEAADRKVFTTYFDDGLLDIFLAAFALMFVIGLFLSVPLGDFWSSAVFLPFLGVVYLILRTIRRRVVTPRIGSVEWGVMRIKKLRKGTIIMLVLNVIFLALGFVAYLMPIGTGLFISIEFGAVMLIFFSTVGYFFDFNFLYVYGLLFALAMPVGEWLYQTAGFSHHGFPVVFGTIAGIMFVRGLVKFLIFLKNNPYSAEEQIA
jgi:hypothetical protein